MDHDLDPKNYQSYRNNCFQLFRDFCQVLMMTIIERSSIDFKELDKEDFQVEDNEP